MRHKANTNQGNQTISTEFILVGFRKLSEQQILLFLLFLVICAVTMDGNLLIVVLVVADRHLHTPMYFFLGNLAFLETSYTCTILPRLLASLLTRDRAISLRGCLVQLYFFGFLVCTECYLLAMMSSERYLAICKPLHYAALMNGRLCFQLAAGSWFRAFLPISIIIFLMSSLTFCGPNEIDHFFCDFTPMIKLSFSNTCLIQSLAFLLASIGILPPFLSTVTCYGCIINTILRIPFTPGREKAFSTCSSHLIMVTSFYGTLMTVYVFPKYNLLGDLHKMTSVFYTVCTPLANPLLYSLRNNEVQLALRKVARKLLTFRRIQRI